MFIQTIYKIGLLSKVTKTGTTLLELLLSKRNSETEALNPEKSPSSSLWILIIIPGFTYMLGRNLELVKKSLCKTGSTFSYILLVFLELILLSLQKRACEVNFVIFGASWL